MPRKLLKVAEATAELQIGRTLLYDLINRGEIQVVRLGRAVRIPRDELDKLIERKRVDTSEDSER